MECHNCGMIFDEGMHRTCPKCESLIQIPLQNKLHSIDIAHNGESLERALEKIEHAIHYAKLERFKGIKFIHGYGSKNDHTHIIHDSVLPYLQKYARENNAKLVPDKKTRGAHILYFKKA